MTNDLDDVDDDSNEDAAETLDWFRHEMRTTGLRAARDTMLAICRDPKAPAPAKATAAGLILRAAGVLERKDNDGETEPRAMTPEQLQREIARLSRIKAGDDQDEARDSGEDGNDGVFG